jgi:hypothetical protein
MQRPPWTGWGGEMLADNSEHGVTFEKISK